MPLACGLDSYPLPSYFSLVLDTIAVAWPLESLTICLVLSGSQLLHLENGFRF